MEKDDDEFDDDEDEEEEKCSVAADTGSRVSTASADPLAALGSSKESEYVDECAVVVVV